MRKFIRFHREVTPGASPVWLPQARESKDANYATLQRVRSPGGRRVRRCSLQKHDHLVQIQDLYFPVLGAKRRTFVCAVDISPFQRKTTPMQFAAHVLRRGGKEPALWLSASD